MNNKNTTALTLNALLIAIVCIATMFTKIPIPLGYMHLGNCCILLAGIFFGKQTGLLAGGIGSALSDLLSGFPEWIIPTLIIKSIMGYTAGKIARNKDGSFKMASVRTVIAAVVSMLIMIAGYFIAGSILYGSIITGASQIPGLSLEAVIGIVLFYVVGLGCEAAKLPKLLSIHHQ